MPLDSLEMFICGESSPKFQIYNNKRLMMLKQERNQNAITEIQENAEKVHRFEILTHSQREEKIERGCEKEREGSPIPIFLPPRFRIVRMLAGWMGICFKVLALRLEHGWLVF